MSVVWGKILLDLRNFQQNIDLVSVGLVTAGICNLCMAASLAEFLSAYPT